MPAKISFKGKTARKFLINFEIESDSTESAELAEEAAPFAAEAMPVKKFIL